MMMKVPPALLSMLLLLHLDCVGAAVEMSANADPETLAQSKAEQCLMQKKHQMNRRSADLKELLPDHLLALGWELFGTEEAVAELVENSELVNVTYGGQHLSLRMAKGDDATTRLGEEGTWFAYDMDTLGSTREETQDMLNMIDIGGNYGLISIVAMKKNPTNLRVITVEPIPTTFFFLKWNLHINGIPELKQASAKTPGVLALNRGSADVDGQDLHLCFAPTSSMNARMCECQRGDNGCLIVPSVTVDNLAGMFGEEPIAMVKMDCEGCEFKTLPALAKPEVAKRVRRLAGELHLPDLALEEIACKWDNGRLMTKCQHPAGSDAWNNVECNVALSCPQ